MIILIIRRKQKKLIGWFPSWYSVFLEFTDFIFLLARCSRILRLVTRYYPQAPSSLFSIATPYQFILRKRSWSTLLIGKTGSQTKGNQMLTDRESTLGLDIIALRMVFVLVVFLFSVGQVNGKVCNLMQNQATHTEKYAGPFLLRFCRSGELSYLHNFFFLTH